MWQLIIKVAQKVGRKVGSWCKIKSKCHILGVLVKEKTPCRGSALPTELCDQIVN